MSSMKIKKNFRLDEESIETLAMLTEKTGLSEAAIVRMLIRNWEKLLSDVK